MGSNETSATRDENFHGARVRMKPLRSERRTAASSGALIKSKEHSRAPRCATAPLLWRNQRNRKCKDQTVTVPGSVQPLRKSHPENPKPARNTRRRPIDKAASVRRSPGVLVASASFFCETSWRSLCALHSHQLARRPADQG